MSLNNALNPSRKKHIRASPDTCAACRTRKVRCDGRRSVCTNCERLGFTCSFEKSQTDGVRSPVVPVSRRRAHLACFACHSRKVRCSEGQPSCRRCGKLGVICVYPVPGHGYGPILPRPTTAPSPHPSSESRSIQVGVRSPRRSDSHAQSSEETVCTLERRLSPPDLQDLGPAANVPYNPIQGSPTPEAPVSYEPSQQLALNALNIFFTSIRHIPIFSFLHQALVMDQYQSKNMDEALLLSLIGVVSVYHDLGPGMVERGNKFITQAETLILRDLENPGVSQVQTLILIIKHRAYRRRFTSAFALTAIATRAAMGLRLNYDDPKLDFLTRECCRRTMWSLYLIDTVMSAGYQDFALSSSRLLHIQLPTHDYNFDFDIPQQGDYLESTHYDPREGTPSTLSLVIRVMDIRYRALEFTKRAVATYDLLEIGPQVDAFQLEFNNYQAQLPAQFQPSTRNIQLHAHSPTLPSFLSIQINWHMSQCNLYRLTMEGLVEALPQHALAALDQNLVKNCQIRCYESAKSLAGFLYAVLSVQLGSPALDLDLAVSIYQCLRILVHAYYTLKIVPKELPELIKASCETCIGFLESMFLECEAAIAIVRSSPSLNHVTLTSWQKEDTHKLMATIPGLSTSPPDEQLGSAKFTEPQLHVFSQHSLVGQVKVPNKDSSFVASPSFTNVNTNHTQPTLFSPSLSHVNCTSGIDIGTLSTGASVVGSLSHEAFDFGMLGFNLDSSILFL